MTNRVQQIYQEQLKENGYTADPAQLRAIDALERCATEWVAYVQGGGVSGSSFLSKLFGGNKGKSSQAPNGVFMYGGVGRGKSFLMDCFMQGLPEDVRAKVTRLHFHEFMRSVHDELAELQGQADPLQKLGEQMSARYRIICFDEFHVSDITDAMILYRLLQSLCDNGVGIVTTSNYHPDGLYPDGLHRDRILPAIELIKETMQVVNVDNGVDYRAQTDAELEVYVSPDDAGAEAVLTATWKKLAHRAVPSKSEPVTVDGRELQATGVAPEVVWFDFDTICRTARSQRDYLELAGRYSHFMLSNVPQMDASDSSAARRFTWLIDVLYDRRVKLVVSAAVEATELYPKGPMAHEFVRTASRLHEMRSKEFLLLPWREVDTSLT